MAGVYIHIPFCKSRCRYCDFFSTTMLNRREEYIRALLAEIRNRKDEINAISTIYFGGGTPSLLAPSEIKILLSEIGSIEPNSEVTMEANPGDLTLERLMAYQEAGINRLSIGIQSLKTPLLQRIGRRHSAEQAVEAVKMAQDAGFCNISVDLMYGLPGQTLEDWLQDLQEVAQMNIQHVSAYCLTYEEGTPLYQELETGKVKELDDELLNRMQDEAEQILNKVGIIRYEVSNYAKKGFESRHNSSYWTHVPYIGLGAGAHSYDGKRTRSWNSNDLEQYLHGENKETETLTDADYFNEQIMLGLRTTKGINIEEINPFYLKHLQKQMDSYIKCNWLHQDGGYISAQGDGWHMLNRIIEDIMI